VWNGFLPVRFAGEQFRRRGDGGDLRPVRFVDSPAPRWLVEAENTDKRASSSSCADLRRRGRISAPPASPPPTPTGTFLRCLWRFSWTLSYRSSSRPSDGRTRPWSARPLGPCRASATRRPRTSPGGKADRTVFWSAPQMFERRGRVRRKRALTGLRQVDESPALQKADVQRIFPLATAAFQNPTPVRFSSVFLITVVGNADHNVAGQGGAGASSVC